MSAPPTSGPAADMLLQTLERAFAAHSGADARIDVAELRKALGLRTEYLARRMLATFDTDGDGFVTKSEFLAGVRALTTGTPRDKLLFAYRLHDHDGDGALTREELLRMVLIGFAEDDVTFDESAADRLVDALFADADRNHDGRITFDEFEALMMRHPHLLDQMTRSEAKWVLPNDEFLERLEGRRTSGGIARLVDNRRLAIAFVAVWALVNVALFATGLVPHGHKPTTLANQISRAATSCILWNAAVILVPVLRRFLTWVRRAPVGRVVPVDDAVAFHRLVGHTLLVFALVHTVAMLDGYAYASVTGAEFLAKLDTKRGVTGVSLVVVLAVMWFFARVKVRRAKSFELFYFTHLLYVPWFVLAILHAPAFVGWAGVPIVGLAIELVVRGVRRGRATSIVAAQPLRSGVTRLQIARPSGFAHRAGDYLFLRVPAVARHEWHPFTISSAPESSALTVHVRSLGNWTGALRRHFEAARVDQPVAAYVDGPYGSPSGHLFESRYAVLVAAGIGVTPFASILESIVLRANGNGERPSALKKAHFFWLNRDQYSFEWFSALLAQLERVDGAALLDLHVFMTGGRSTASAAALEVARELLQAQGAPDLVTGLRAKTHMGQPDWHRELGAIAAAHAPDRVDVFFCGPPGLGHKLRAVCSHVGMGFREERF